jgi:hypothetical protein
MNCFNIRELQGILKRKFFTDLVNSNDHRMLFDKSIIGLRFKNNNNLNINHDMSLFYNFGTTNVMKSKNTLLTNNYSSSKTETLYNTVTTFSLTSFNYTVMNLLFFIKNSLISLFTINLSSLTSILYLPSYVTLFVTTNINILPSFNTFLSGNINTSSTLNRTGVSYTSENLNTQDLGNISKSSMSELSTSLRFTRFNNPLISYDYKCGNYLGI